MSNDNRPWHAWYDRIVEVKVGDGITRVGNAAFTDLAYLDLIDLGNTVQTVGNLEINYDFPKVKRGQTVYARMRAYKNTSNDVVYSKWTKIKHAKWK